MFNLEDKGFLKIYLTEEQLLCSIVPVSAVHQHEPAIRVQVSPLLNLPPTSHPVPVLEAVTEPWLELQESQSRFPRVV